MPAKYLNLPVDPEKDVKRPTLENSRSTELNIHFQSIFWKYYVADMVLQKMHSAEELHPAAKSVREYCDSLENK